MHLSTSSKVSPWIERLILSYNSPEEGSSGILKAHVIGTGHLSQSQAQEQGSDNPAGLLFLSDDVLRIPAVLTAAAWEHLQNQEERESLTSLLNTTVRFRDYRLLFHMAAEQTRSKFFLSVGKLEMASAGPARDSTPCCTTLPSVRLKICQTWRAMQEPDVAGSAASQGGLELTELLGEWQLDCVQTAVEDVKGRLAQPQDCVATGWDADRVQYKGESSFTVPPGCLFIPEMDGVNNQAPDSELPRTSQAVSGDPSPPPEASRVSVDVASWKIDDLPALQVESDARQTSTSYTEEEIRQEETVVQLADSSVQPLSNPWDIFPPPRATSSSSEASSLDATPPNFRPDVAEFECSTQVLAEGLKPSDASFLTPYQKVQRSSSDPIPAVPSTSAEVTRSRAAAEKLCADEAQQHPASQPESHSLNVTPEEGKGREAKRRREEEPPQLEEEDLVPSSSPRSWICSTVDSSRASQDQLWASGLRWASAKTSYVHSDGAAFSYSYSVSGQNLVDLSRFQVSGPCLQWAVRYLLLPQQNDNRLHT